MADPNKIAKARHARNAGSATNTPQVKDADPVGVAGEMIFAKWAGIDASPVNTLGPDRGWDFVAWDGRTIDVKSTNYGAPDPGAKKKIGLFADENHVRADVYVLVYVDDIPTKTGTVMGWATGEEMRAAPLRGTKKAGTSYELRGHWLHRFKLRTPRSLQVTRPVPPAAVRSYEENAALRPLVVKREVLVLGRLCPVRMTGTEDLAWVELIDQGHAYQAIIYRATRRVGKTKTHLWYVVHDPVNKGYATWEIAAAAGLRMAILGNRHYPEPTVPEVPPEYVNGELDFGD